MPPHFCSECSFLFYSTAQGLFWNFPLAQWVSASSVQWTHLGELYNWSMPRSYPQRSNCNVTWTEVFSKHPRQLWSTGVVEKGALRISWESLYCFSTGSSLTSGSPWLMFSRFGPWLRCTILSNSFAGEDTGKIRVFRSFCVGANFISRSLRPT